MLIQTLLISILGAGSPFIEEQNTPPVQSHPIEQAEESENEEEDEIADRDSKNRQEYNLYDREENRGNPSSQGQYYYYQQQPQQPGYNNQSRKLYQRDDG